MAHHDQFGSDRHFSPTLSPAAKFGFPETWLFGTKCNDINTIMKNIVGKGTQPGTQSPVSRECGDRPETTRVSSPRMNTPRHATAHPPRKNFEPGGTVPSMPNRRNPPTTS